jgi:diguanylate cyclase (GGDEF)-like protein
MIDDEKKTKSAIHLDTYGSICNDSTFQNALECRAYRTETDIISTDFYQLCQGCKNAEAFYSCFFYSINDDYSLVISMTAKDKIQLENINEKIPHLRNYLEAAKPVIESKLLMEKLRDNSLRDGMTGLYNRRFLEEFISQFMRQADRNKDTYHVFMLDVDYFKKVNDTYGHDIGDKVIIAIGELLMKSIRSSDLAIRYGGEEFIVMLHNSTDEGALFVAKNIHSAFATIEFNVGTDGVIHKTISIGISKFPNHGETIWECIKCADTALYEAKETGRDKIVMYKKS